MPRADRQVQWFNCRTVSLCEVVAVIKAHRNEHYSGSDPEQVALQMDYDDFCSQDPSRFSPCMCMDHIPDEHFSTLLRYGLSLDGMFKIALRRAAGIDSESVHRYDYTYGD